MSSTVVNIIDRCKQRHACEAVVPNTDNGSESVGGYAAQLDALRSVAKWLVAVFAGVGALLVAGLSISGIGQLPASSWRLYVAVSSVVFALGSVGFMIREASVVLTHEWLTLASFGDEPTGRTLGRAKRSWRQAQLRDIDEKLCLSRHELFGYAAATRAQLHRLLREADELIHSSAPDSPEAHNAQQEAAVLRRAARDTVQYANYCFTLRLFQRMRTRVSLAAVVAAISIGIFAYTTNSPEPALDVHLQHVTGAGAKYLPMPYGLAQSYRLHTSHNDQSSCQNDLSLSRPAGGMRPSALKSSGAVHPDT
jgi:hypothetical protein